MVALLFATCTVTTAQRKVATDELQVTSLKSVEVLKTDEQGNVVAGELPEVDLAPIQTELDKKLDAGTYTGTASDLVEDITNSGKVKTVNGNQPDENGNIEIETGGVQSDWNQTDSNSPDYIKNKPNSSGQLVKVTKKGKTGYCLEEYSALHTIIGRGSVNLGVKIFEDDISVSGDFSTISGGAGNCITGKISVISGGNGNRITGRASVISGGNGNKCDAFASTISGGSLNQCIGDFSTVTGGCYNKAQSYAETVVGCFSEEYTPLSATRFEKEDRLFVIGNGYNYDNRSNALVVYKSGNMDLNGLLKLQPTGQPEKPKKGMIYFDKIDNVLKCYNGSEWKNLF